MLRLTTKVIGLHEVLIKKRNGTSGYQLFLMSRFKELLKKSVLKALGDPPEVI